MSTNLSALFHHNLKLMKHVIASFHVASFFLLEACLCQGAGQTWVVGWGDNTVGETGLPFVAKLSTNEPVKVPGYVYTNILAIAAGSGHSLALCADGTIFGWGGNSAGEAAGFETPYPYIPRGKVKVFGKSLEDIVAISAGDFFSLALKQDGTVVSWGDGRWSNRDQISVPSGVSNVIAIAAGGNCSVVLKNDGTIFGWGDRQPPASLSNIVKIAVGHGDFSPCLALSSDGSIIGWAGVDRVLPVPVEATNVMSIAAGAGHSLALRKDGTVVGWGRNRDGQATGVPIRSFPSETNGLVRLGGRVLSNVVAIAAGGDFSLALKSDGSVIGWGDNSFHQIETPVGLSNVVAIAAGNQFCLAITTNKAVADRFSH